MSIKDQIQWAVDVLQSPIFTHTLQDCRQNINTFIDQ